MLITDYLVLTAIFFVLGTVIGSFLNVVIHRLPADKSIVFPSSKCPHCQTAIKFYDNIPLVSWLILLRGRCRACRAPISWRYPLVEGLTGVLFAVFFLHDGLSWLLPFNLMFAAAMIALIFIDAEQMILPDAITYPGFAVALLARLLLPFLQSTIPFENSPSDYQSTLPLWVNSLLGAALGAALGGGSLWLVGKLWKVLRGVEGMGFGDVKMMLMVGAFIGWRLTVLSIFLAAATGALLGIIVIGRQKDKDYQTRIPFGIFLGLGSLISILAGEQIINWYISNFIPR